jgi:hypothetical protein
MITTKSKPCGECHRCCEGYVWGEAYGHQFRLGRPCGLLSQGRCLVYPNHPQDPCKTFECGWKSQAAWPPDLRPDLSNIIFLRRNLEEYQYWYGVRCKTYPSDSTLLWLRDYHRRSGQDFLVDKDATTYVLYSQHAQLRDLMQQRYTNYDVIWQT